MKNFLIVLLLTFAATCGAQSAPTVNGIYLKSNGAWEPLSTLAISGSRTEGAGRSMLTGGIAHISTNTIYRDSAAPVSTQDAIPIFCIIGPSIAEQRNMAIVRLQQKRGHRELQTMTFGTYHGADMEYPPKDTTQVTESQSGTCMLLSPVSPLKPGQYILFAKALPIAGYGGYDFGVSLSH